MVFVWARNDMTLKHQIAAIKDPVVQAFAKDKPQIPDLLVRYRFLSRFVASFGPFQSDDFPIRDPNIYLGSAGEAVVSWSLNSGNRYGIISPETEFLFTRGEKAERMNVLAGILQTEFDDQILLSRKGERVVIPGVHPEAKDKNLVFSALQGRYVYYICEFSDQFNHSS